MYFMRTGATISFSGTTTRGYMICLTGTLIWSTTGILIRYLTENYGMPPLALAIWRDLFVSIGLASGLALLSPSKLRMERRHAGFLIAYGLVVSVFNTAWTFSVALNGAAVATVLAYSAPAFTALLGWRLFGEKLGAFKLVIVFASILGCALVSGAYDPAVWQLNPLGAATGLLSGLMFSFYSLMGKLSNQRGLNSWSTLMVAFGVATLFLFLYNLANGIFTSRDPLADLLWLGESASGWGLLALLGLGPTIGGYGLYTFSLTILPMSVASLIATLEPAFTALLAALLLAEQMTLVQLLGSAMILVSVILLRLRE
jgi:drug/metabolite transporter (DMT)-like permease